MEAPRVIHDGPGNCEVVFDPASSDSEKVIQRLLRAVREHLGLDVAFVGELVGNDRVFRYVDAGPGVDAVSVGGADPREASYCHYVVGGELPEFMRDPSQHPVAAKLPATRELPVGSHLSVPIRFSDGRIHGTFCCFSFDVRASLEPSDLLPLRMIEELAAEYREAVEQLQVDRQRRRRTIARILEDADAMTLVVQPLRHLDTMEIVALEALARFPGHDSGPGWFFAEAAEVGLGIELEMKALRMALDTFDGIAAPIRLNVNVSPVTLGSPESSMRSPTRPPTALSSRSQNTTSSTTTASFGPRCTDSRRPASRLRSTTSAWGSSGLNRILQTSPQELKLDAAVVRRTGRDSVNPGSIPAIERRILRQLSDLGGPASFQLAHMPNGGTMNFFARAAALAAAIVVMATPAFAAGPPADTPTRDDNPGTEQKPEGTPPSNEGTARKPATPGPKAGLPAKAKAYGRHCKGQSKKRSDAAPDTKGTPFSQCVTAMAKLATGKSSSPRTACKDLSKKREEGEKGTPFGRCVSQGAKLLREQKQNDEESQE